MTKEPSHKDDAVLNQPLEVQEAARVTAEYLSTIIHMSSRQVEISANAYIAAEA